MYLKFIKNFVIHLQITKFIELNLKYFSKIVIVSPTILIN